MDTIQQSDGEIEFSEQLEWAARILVLAGGVLPLLAPYELLVRPGWRGASTPIWLFFVVLAAGAVAISALLLSAAVFGWSDRIGFDSERRVVTWRFRSPLLRPHEHRYPFTAVDTLHMATHHWTGGPATDNLALKLGDGRAIEFGHFTERRDAERYLSALRMLISHGP